MGAAAGAAGAAGCVSCCCPNIKVFARVGSEEELWPNIKVLVGAAAWEEVVGVPKRLGVELEEAGVLDELKPKVGFGADASGRHIISVKPCCYTSQSFEV